MIVFDRRTELAGKPGLHALICGVSAYPNLPQAQQPQTPHSYGLRKLSSTALAAYKVYRWLAAHKDSFPVPLATVRLLLTPSPAEIDAVQNEVDLTTLAKSCSLQNFLQTASDWRKDAASHRDNIALFYFAGHGAQRTKDDAVLLLEEFGDGVGGPLRATVELRNIFNGMAKSADYPEIAQTQLYFVDTCRDFLSEFRKIERPNTTDVFEVGLAGEDLRNAPIFYAAAPGTQAQGIPGDQTLFSKALLACLENDAGDFKAIEGEDRWHISVDSLKNALRVKLNELKEQFSAEQDFIVSGLVADAIILFLDKIPEVDVILEIDPPYALAHTKIQVYNADVVQPLPELPKPLDPYPYRTKWPAGFYKIDAVIEPPDARFKDVPGNPRPVLPPYYQKKVRVSR